MTGFARVFLCMILLVSFLSGPAMPAASQGETPPPPPSSDDVFEEQVSTGQEVVPVDPGPSEAIGVVPGIASNETETIQAYRSNYPSLMLASEEHYNVAGSAFQPRNSNVKINYSGGGCIFASGFGGNEDNNAFTAPVNLPEGAVILGVRLFGYDNTANDMGLHLVQFDGKGGFTDLVNVVSPASTAGNFSAYASLASPVTVTNNTKAMSLVWYQYEASADLRLCGARILYTMPFPPIFSARINTEDQAAQLEEGGTFPRLLTRRSFSTFIAGHDFLPRNSSAAYSYTGAGCITSTSGEMFVADLDVPDGAVLTGLRLFYYDANTSADIVYYLTRYDGIGTTDDIIGSATSGITTGYGSVSVRLLTPIGIDQFTYSTVVQARLPGEANVHLCGMQATWEKNVGYVSISGSGSGDLAEAAEETEILRNTPNLLRNEVHYRFIAGSAFQPRTADVSVTYDSGGCTHLSSGAILTADLQLPPGAKIAGVRLYTYDASGLDSSLFVAEYDMAGFYNEFMIIDSVGSSGYGSNFVPLVPEYTINRDRPLALAWNSGFVTDNTMRLCGARVFYSHDDHMTGIFLPVIR